MNTIDDSYEGGNDDDRHQILLEIDGTAHAIDPIALSEPDGQAELRLICSGAQAVVIRHWERVVNLPSEVRNFLIELVASNDGTQVEAAVTGVQPTFSDPFEATLSIVVDGSNLSFVGNATDTAIAAASVVCPGAARQAASHIKQWLRRNNVESDPAPAIAARIRRESPTTTESERATPQDVANRVLGLMQARREERGEDTSTSPPVRYHQGEFHEWSANSWKANRDFELKVVRDLQSVTPDKDITTNFSNSVLQNIKALTLLPANAFSYPWLVQGTEASAQPVHALSLRNGLLYLDPIVAGDPGLTLRPHDPRVFGAQELDYEFQAAADCPRWRETLSQIFPPGIEGDQRINVLQEFFGYCLAPWNHRFEIFMILFGDGANGKSVVLDVLRAMLGRANVSDVPLDVFGSEFRLADMFGKLANIGTDMQRIAKVQEGVLKQLVSGEPTQVNRKFKDPATMYPSAKLIFATNYLPPFGDTSDGLWRRMIVVPFNERFTEDDRDMYRAQHIINDELPGVLNWAIEGLRRLLLQNRFTTCEVCAAAKSGHRHESDPFNQFVDECCELGPENEELAPKLYEAYRGFCESIGKKPKAKQEIGRQLRRLSVEKVRATTGRRPYQYTGIKLRIGVMRQRPLSNECYQPPGEMDLRDQTANRPRINHNIVSSNGTSTSSNDVPST